MARLSTPILASGTVIAALILAAAGRPSVLAVTQPGLWEISGAPAAKMPMRRCVADVAALARFEHRSNICTSRILKDDGSSISIDYTCGGAGFGHSQIDVITPRSLRISTQGISAGLPFNYVLQARRVDDCPKAAASAHH